MKSLPAFLNDGVSHKCSRGLSAGLVLGLLAFSVGLGACDDATYMSEDNRSVEAQEPTAAEPESTVVEPEVVDDEMVGRPFEDALCDTPAEALELAIDTVEIRGAILLDGEPIVRADSRGPGFQVLFVDTETEQSYFGSEFWQDGKAFDVQLFAGSYDVYIHFNSQHERFAQYNNARVHMGVYDLTSSQDLTLSVDFEPFEGAVQIDGRALETIPSGWNQYGWVRFLDTENQTELSVTLDPSLDDPSTFALEVPSGRTYDVVWDIPFVSANYENFSEEELAQVRAIPFGSAHLGRFDAEDGQVRANVDSVLVEGEVTLGGLPLSNANAEFGTRGYVEFSHLGANSGLSPKRLDLGLTGPGTYQTRLLQGGEYAIETVVHGSLNGREIPSFTEVEICGAQTPPCTFTRDTRLDIEPWEELAALDVSVGGVIVAQGAPWEADDSFGSLYFTSLDNGAVIRADVFRDGDYLVDLGQESYRVVFEANGTIPGTENKRSYGSIVLSESFTPAEDTTRQNWTVELVRFQGEMLRNGEEMPESMLATGERRWSQQRGTLILENPETNRRVLYDFEQEGAAIFDMPVVAGTYEARFANVYPARSFIGVTLHVNDILPVGTKELGTVSIAAQNRTSGMEKNFDLKVRRLRSSVDYTGVPLPSYIEESIVFEEGPLLHFESEEGHSIFAFAPFDNTFDVFLYEGSYHMEMWEASYSGLQPFGRTYLGSLCVTAP